MIATCALVGGTMGVLSTMVQVDTYEKTLIAGTALLVSGICILGFARWPPVGLAALVLSGLLMPTFVDSAVDRRLNATFVLAPILIVLWLLGMAKRGITPRENAARQNRPLLLLLSVCVLSFLVGQFPWFPRSQAPLDAQLGGLAIFLFSGGAFFMASYHLRSLRWLRVIVWTFLAAAAIRVVLLYLPDAVLRPFSMFAAAPLLPTSPLGSMFWTWLMALTFGQLVGNPHLRRRFKLALASLLSLVVYITFFPWRDWASGWLPGFVAMFVILALMKPRVAVLLLCAGITLVLYKQERLSDALWTPDQQYSYVSRSHAAATLSEIARKDLLFGLGPANYYHYTPLYPIAGWFVHFSSHSTYLDLILQVGIVGLICYGWFLLSVGWLAVRLRKQVRPGFALGYVYGAAGGLVGTACAGGLGDWVLPFAYNVGVAGFRSSILAWIFLGGLAGLGHIVTAQEGGNSDGAAGWSDSGGQRCDA